MGIYRDETALNNAGAAIDFPGDDDNSIVSFQFKQKIIGQVMLVV